MNQVEFTQIKGGVVMNITANSYSPLAWLPVIDWNVKFHGAHTQSVVQHWQAPKESHISFEILMVMQGTQVTHMLNQSYRLVAGDIILIPPGVTHLNECIEQDGLTYFCAHFNVDDPIFRLELIRNQLIVYPSGTTENEQLRKYIYQWLNMISNQDTYSMADRFQLQIILFQCLQWFAEWIEAKKQHELNVAPIALHYAKHIAEAIKAYFAPHDPNAPIEELGDLRIEHIIQSLGISTGYGLEVFRKVYGVSPRQYLSELKLHEAKVFIHQSHLSLTDIAIKLGYSHLSHFSRQFKRWTGMSPLEYRNMTTTESYHTEIGLQ